MTPFWIAFGDVHNDLSLLPRIPDLREAAGVIVTGDLTLGQGADRVRGIIEDIRRFNPAVLAQFGNMDRADTTAYLDQQGVNIHLRAHTLHVGTSGETGGSLGLVGVGASTPTPFNTPSEFPESRIASWLDEAWKLRGDWDHTILVCHTPPLDTATDMLSDGTHVGSPGVRAFIEQHQPDICLTGHIHESRALDTIGATTVVNPGNFGSGGYVRVETTPDGPRAELLTV